jgi:DNA ligase-1
MRRFSELYRQLDETTRTGRKVTAMSDYFAAVDAADGAWAVYFLCGRRLKRVILSRNLQLWCSEAAGIPDWLFDECRETVGDLAETIALLLSAPAGASDMCLHRWVEEAIIPLAQLSENQQRELLFQSWGQLMPEERLVFNKLVTGEFRIGVSQGLVIRALAAASGLPVQVLAHRLTGFWEPTAEFFQALLSPEAPDADLSRPYPFCLAHPLQADPASLGNPEEWLIEWKWDGIRAQMIRRQGASFLWSRGEELITDRFPELTEDMLRLPDGTVLDGEIVGWKEGRVLPFGNLQQRIGRKKLGQKLLADVPVGFMAFDLLENGGIDSRELPLSERRGLLEGLLIRIGASRIMLSPRIVAPSWEEVRSLRETSRERQVEGFMLKKLVSAYVGGRVTGLWWKWKIDPFSCDAVLIYAQRGHGRRASLYTDYTFGLWDNQELVPFAKAYSGLSDEEIHEVDRFVRRNTLERFGPVHAVKPELVFELAFDGIQRSSRHKSGIAVRFPRMARWRRDKKPQEADSLDSVKALLDHFSPLSPRERGRG